MPSNPIERLLEQRCKDLCHRLGLAQVYVTHAFGRRRHYLAGYGQPLPSQPEQMPLSPHIVVFWHGELSEQARGSLKADFEKLTDFLEEQLTRPVASGHRSDVPNANAPANGATLEWSESSDGPLF